MVKVRMNTADVAAEVKCLRRLIGMRCSNVYDLSPKTYVFKLMNSSGITESGESEKVLLLMESGVRLYTTEYLRDKSNTPSGFTLKLRKHIRTRRLEDVRQLGYDRIILFQFGVGANAYYIILELYAQGNIILTDSEYMVLTLLRSHRDDDKGFAIMARHHYPVEICRVFERTDGAKLQATLKSFNNTQESNEPVEDIAGGNEEPQGKKGNRKATKSNDSSKKKDNANAKQATLKVVLGEALGYGPALSEHIILDAGLTPTLKVSKDLKLGDSSIQALSEGVKRFEDWLEDVISGTKVPEGYILMQQKKTGKDQIPVESSGTDQIYDEFCPLLLNQFNSRVSVKFETFDDALDEFYSKIESQRSEQQAKESSGMQKLSKIRNDQIEGKNGEIMKEKQIEGKNGEIMKEKQKRREVVDAYKKLKSQYNYLCSKSGLTPENIHGSISTILNKNSLGHDQNILNSPVLEKKCTDCLMPACETTNHNINQQNPQYSKGSSSSSCLAPRPDSKKKTNLLSGTKRPISHWRDTRPTKNRNGADPHDDFLDTPLENIKDDMRKAAKGEDIHHLPGPAPKDMNFDSSDDETQVLNAADPDPQRPEKKSFKYVEPVRKKAERANLKGVECKECKKFYDAVLPPDGGDNNNKQNSRCEHHEGVSRHRYRFAPPLTPEGFWNIGFESEM